LILFSAQQQPGNGDPSSKDQLSKLSELIGEWRGIGQERRGSSRGAWKQTGAFVWDFTQDSPAIVYNVDEGKLTTTARIGWDPKNKSYLLELKTPEEAERNYSGKWQGKKLRFVANAGADKIGHRITITPLNEKRTLVLHEKTSPGGTSFRRVAEVGYTKEGTRLAIPGGGQRECVVTGGAATTPVMHKGKTYYVCCSGCLQAFNDDPEGIIAEFKQRLEKRKKKFQSGE